MSLINQQSINLNDVIYVRLTDYGKDLFYHQYDDLNRERGKVIIQPHMPQVDQFGYTKFQLWEFMQIYGRQMYAGGRNVIEPIEIYFGVPPHHGACEYCGTEY